MGGGVGKLGVHEWGGLRPTPSEPGAFARTGLVGAARELM